MPDLFQSLLTAILGDACDQVNDLLELDPNLARSGCATGDRYEDGIVHWIYSGDTALHVAAAGYRVEIAGILLQAGADPESAENRRRSQPLHYAADGHPGSPSWNPARQVAVIHLLSKAGANLNSQDQNGATPLHRAVRTRCAAAVKCLLEAGADPTIKNRPGSTPFHLAAQNTGRGGSGAEAARTAQRQIVETFLAHRVSPHLLDANGRSVLEWTNSDWVRKILANKGG